MSGYKGKVVLHWHSDILKQKILLKFYMPLQNWLIRRADVIVGTTPKYLNESPHLIGGDKEKIAVPIGINPVDPNTQEVSKLRNAYAGKRIVFTLGRLVGYKGFEFLVDAAKYLSDEYVILIGGSGPLMGDLERQINESNLSNKVKLLGRISDYDLPNYFGACDLFVLSSIWKTEAFGIVQIEAMSCGKPVVATHIPESGVDWVNKDGYSGINVEPQNPRAIADAIVSITQDSSKYSQFSRNARLRFEQNFTLDKMINQCIDIYKKLNNKEK
jgi:rhamnosyl/mannosyltransferase